MALSDTLSTPTGGQKNGEKIKPKNGENFGTKTGIIFVPAFFSIGPAHQSRPAQAMTSHRSISKSWCGSRQVRGTPAGAAGPAEAGPAATGVSAR